MKKKYLLMLLCFLSIGNIYSQTTETFETESATATNFTDNGQVFNITSAIAGSFSIFDSAGLSFGWNGTATDQKFIDNSGVAQTGTPVSFTISSAANAPFKLKSFYLFLATEVLTQGSGSCTITGKKNGTTVFTATSNTGFVDPTNASINNGFTFINMSSYGGSDNSNKIIDQFVIATTGTFEYLALDAMRWQSVTVPTVTTDDATAIGSTRATLGGNVTADGGATVTERGIVWSTTANPTTANNKVTNGSGTGTFSAAVSGLTAGTLLHVRSYAINAAGTVYGLDKTFTTSAALTATQSQTNVSCNGGSNGTATVTTSGGSPSYTFSWSPSGGSAATASGLTSGTYTCNITDAELTVVMKTFTIAQPSAITSSVAAQTNIVCFGGSNGTASINNPSGGAGGYTYNWAPGNPAGDGTTSISGLSAGTYTCTITDANSCTATQSVTITQPTAITSNVSSQTNVSCFGGSNGAASINNPSGGAGGYTYNWTPGNPAGDGTTSISGLSAGTYTCTITDANSCTATQSVTITQPTAITSSVASQTNVSCNGGSNGIATITAGGGTPSYTYSWSPSGGTAATATGLSVGTYTCTITDANSCTATQSVTITQPTAITSNVSSQTNVSCFGGSNGAASINNPSGGAGGYTYNWTPGNPAGDGTTSISGLSAGTYTCTITDANSCTKQQSVIITQPTAITSSVASQTNVSCNGGSNGIATITAGGGTPSYTYSWSPSGGTAATATGLTAGTYTCTITDANSCTVTQSVIITQPAVQPDNVTTQSACATYTWANNGQTYTTSGTYTGTTTNCVTEKLNLTINATPTITGNSAQTLNITATLADIVVSPTNVVWYASLANATSGTSPLANSTTVANATYYAVNTTNSCPSIPFAVTVSAVNLSNENFDLPNLIVYPNPTNGIVNIKNNNNINQVKVYNLLGQLIIDKKENTNNVSLDLSDFPSQLFTIKVWSDEFEKTIKILKN